LKASPIKKWAASIGLLHRQYMMAVGIRADESRRASGSDKDRYCIYHPLIELGIDKSDVNYFWEQQSFTLNLQEHQGNCKWCYKKSAKKHAMLYSESPEIYQFPIELERMCDDSRKIFRGNRDTAEHIEYIRSIDILNTPTHHDLSGGCSESCEAFV
jgi:hypothetical protein